MTRYEFGVTMNYIGVAVGKPMEDANALDVYFDLLGDLPADVFRLAAKRVVLSHKYPTFPSVAELRAAALDAHQGDTGGGLPVAEAWRLAWQAVGKIDLDIDGSKDRHLASLPPAVAETINALGLANLIHGKDPVPVVRAQFSKAYEQIAARDRQRALLPAPVREAIEARAAPPVLKLADALKMPEGVPHD